MIEKNFGHISHCKMLRDGSVFIVRNLNKCEIRRLDETFSLVNEFLHIGEEVYAIDIIYDDEMSKDSIIQNNDKERVGVEIVQIASKLKKISDKPFDKNDSGEEENSKKGYSNNMNQEEIGNQLNMTEEKKDEIKFTITLVDIDGNVNTYREGNIQKEFNLYEIDNISQDQKDKQFFSLGYAYYIRFDGAFFCVSSDHGCHIITSNSD